MTYSNPRDQAVDDAGERRQVVDHLGADNVGV